jgi:hypothetical protein
MLFLKVWKTNREMDINEYISKQPPERQKILTSINMTILETDKTIKGEVAAMMGKEMIVYKGKGLMKYGLASGKNYMSLHVLPIYGSPALHSKYKTLLNKANFQKGCINFDTEEKMPVDIVKKLIEDCSSIDLIKIIEDRLKLKKSKSKT